ncbi:type IV secretory system conjugative DNA transfer family protein [Nocardiopsis sp. FR4]|uniref:type IV secretory system conjugative DNA transfer family protein n=1 Tax=Nocardiopsis sp. FR4 TaxID=2605985 RepID=UPI0019158676|nr:type IV secretory system conjugative DNA transfer family protein [Nocardiopsis sp. FR4]
MVTGFLSRLAAEPGLSPVVLEARADHDGIRHLVGAPVHHLSRLRRLFTDILPGAILTGTPAAVRPTMTATARLRLRPAGMPLRADSAEATSRALLAALAIHLSAGEALAVQVVLGGRRAPRLVPKTVADPGTSIPQLLTRGERPADSEVRQQLKARLGQVGLRATIRLGAAAGDAERRRYLVLKLLGAISTAQSAGLRIELVREAAHKLNDAASPWWWPFAPGVSELAGLLGWPLGEGDLPGMPPLHPKPLRAANDVHAGERVFARSAVPGDDRRLGISAQDQTFHGVAYGPSGSGKSNALLHLIMADIAAGRPVVVLDPKRQLIDEILARLPEERIGDVVELNAADETPVGFNPLDVSGRDPDVVVDGILAVFEAVFADGWGPRTADIFSASLRTLSRASTAKNPATLLDLPQLLTDAAFRRQRVGRVQDDVAMAGFWAWYEGQSPAAQAAAIASPLNKLRQFLLRPALIRMLDQREGRFRLRDVFRDNKVVLVPLNEGLIGPGTASLLGSLIIAEVWQATQERASEADVSNKPGVVYVDEALRGAVDINARSKIQFATEHGDAQAAAKLAPELTAEDFIALPRFHAYANLVANGRPSGWALVETLPPLPGTRDVEQVRQIIRDNYAPLSSEDVPDAEPQAPASEADEEAAPPPGEGDRIGRKRRTGGKR